MRALSKYWTRWVPFDPSLNGSWSDLPGVGPHTQVRATLPSATGASVRCHTRWKAGSAKPWVCAPTIAEGPSSPADMTLKDIAHAIVARDTFVCFLLVSISLPLVAGAILLPSALSC